MYNKEERVIHFIFKAFSGKFRKKENIELAFHSMSVGNMLKNMNLSEDTVLSGYLHDIIEDTDYDYNYIKEHFGKKIADNVLIVSDDFSFKNWKERKIDFIERIEKSSDDIIYIELADKLHNLISDYKIFLERGKEIFQSSKSSYAERKWYYLKFRDIFNERLEENEYLKRYNEITSIYFK